jgi:hypothetical protein
MALYDYQQEHECAHLQNAHVCHFKHLNNWNKVLYGFEKFFVIVFYVEAALKIFA